MPGYDYDREKYGYGGSRGTASQGGGGGDYSWMTDPNAPWNRLMDTTQLEKIREMQMKSLETQMGQRGEELSQQVGKSWWGTGAGTKGVTSSIPGQRYAKQYGDLTRSFYQPASSQIEQQFQSGVMGQREKAMEQLYGRGMLERQLQADEPGFWDRFQDFMDSVAEAIPG